MPPLFLSPARPLTTSTGRGERYQVDSGTLRLPSVFWTDLVDVLRLAVAGFWASDQDLNGRYRIGSSCVRLRNRVRSLLELERGWDPANKRAEVITYLTRGLRALGEGEAQTDPLEEALALLRAALEAVSGEEAPDQKA